jgi:hypothetical protein
MNQIAKLRYLSEPIFCGHCGAPMRVVLSQRIYQIYEFRNGKYEIAEKVCNEADVTLMCHECAHNEFGDNRNLIKKGIVK